MPDMILVRHDTPAFTEAEKEVVRRFLFGFVDGLGELNRRMWRRFWWQILNKLEIGEVVNIKTNKTRSGPFHRRHMKLESVVFESQERFELFEQFLCWIKVGAGHVDWLPGAKGAVMPIPRSISYAKMEDGEFREFHGNVIAFMRTPHFGKCLWPHLGVNKREEMVESILGSFHE